MSKAANLVSKAALRVIPLDRIGVDASYQRGVVPKHKKIVSEFNKDALGIPLVAERDDGSLWVVDGLQRVTALRKLEKATVRAEVFRSTGPEYEAEVFRLVNQNRTKLSAAELFHAILTAGDAVCWELKRAAERLGYRIPVGGKRSKATDPAAAARELTCVNSLVRIVREKGAVPVEFILSTLRAAWPDDPLGVKLEVVDGLFTFWRRHEGVVDSARLVPRLQTVTCAKLIYSAQLGVGDRGSNVADVIERIYRKRLGRKSA